VTSDAFVVAQAIQNFINGELVDPVDGPRAEDLVADKSENTGRPWNAESPGRREANPVG